MDEKLVPREPTPEMIAAAARIPNARDGERWEAMWDAAPGADWVAELDAALAAAQRRIAKLERRISAAHDFFQRIPAVTEDRDEAITQIINGCAILRGDDA